MLIHGTQFKSAIAGATTKRIICEKCGHRYLFEMVRRGGGRASTVNGIAEGFAQDRATSAAQQDLAVLLQKETDPVPCPACGWLQSDMVRDMDRQRYRLLKGAGWTLVILCSPLLILFAIAMISTGVAIPKTHEGRVSQAVILGGTAIGLGIPLLLIPMLQRIFSPNAKWQTKTPRADQTRQADGWNAATVVKSRLSSGEPSADPDRWWGVQLLRLNYPPMCCACLSNEPHIMYLKMFGTVSRLPIPVCAECQRRMKRRVLRWTLVSALAAATAASLACIIATREVIPGMIVLAAIAAATVVAATIRFMMPSFIEPVRYRRFSRDYNTIQLRFRNPEFHKAFISLNP